MTAPALAEAVSAAARGSAVAASVYPWLRLCGKTVEVLWIMHVGVTYQDSDLVNSVQMSLPLGSCQ